VTIPILTKITLPPLPAHFVPRARLITLLDAGQSAKLVLVSAAAGFGKSTLIRHWLATVDGKSAWITLDAGDDDLSVFLGLLVGALRENLGENLAFMLELPTPPPNHILLGTLLNELYTLPHHIYIVLDDYHLIQQPAIHEAVDYLLQHLPPNVTLVITARYVPPLAISRLRAKGQLLEIRADDLRFSADEAAAFIADSDIAPEILNRTEGWIAGLQLALIPRHPAALASEGYILDFLLDEVLMQQSDDVRDFLMKTSIFTQFCAESCDSVLDRSDSQAMIAHLLRLNLFINALDGRWYRYHGLFVELLRSRLDAQSAANLHRRAARWFSDHDLPDDALSHAHAVHDDELSVSIIESHAYDLLYSERTHTLQRWLDALPAPLRQDHPRLRLLQGWILARQARRADLKPLVAALAAVIPDSDGEFAALRSVLLQWEESPIERYRLAEQARTQVPLSNRFIHAQIAQVLAMTYTGFNRLEDYGRLIHTQHQTGNDRALLQSDQAHIFISVLQGELDRAEQTSRRALDLAIRLNALESQIPILQEAGLIAYHRNHFAEAEALLTRALDLGRSVYLLNQLTIPAYSLAWLLHLRGDHAACDKLMGEAESYAHYHYTPGLVELLAAAQARLWLSRGDHRSALRWADSYTINFEELPAIMCISVSIWQLQCFLVRPSPARITRAASLVDHILDLALSRRLYGMALYPLLEKALILEQQNHPQAAQEVLTQALEYGSAQHNLRFAADIGAGAAALLKRYLSDNPASPLTGYVQSLLAVMETEPTVPLTDRELEILRLLVAGHSNEQIGEALVIALGTVKKHTSTIYAKLGVANRTQAVLRAQELRLTTSIPGKPF